MKRISLFLLIIIATTISGCFNRKEPQTSAATTISQETIKPEISCKTLYKPCEEKKCVHKVSQQKKKSQKKQRAVKTISSSQITKKEQENSAKKTLEITMQKEPQVVPKPEVKDIQEISQIDDSRKVEIQNNITPSMLKVNHWTGTYTPSMLSISINDIPIVAINKKQKFKQATQHTIPISGNTFKVSFDYEFLNGARKGSSITYYKLKENIRNLSMEFSWDTPWHVAFDQANPIQ